VHPSANSDEFWTALRGFFRPWPWVPLPDGGDVQSKI
jgi:hypothetical protein